MQFLLAIVVGGLYAAALYTMMRRSMIKLLIGLVLLSHAAHLLIFTSAGLTRGRPPVVAEEDEQLAAGSSDPLPQAVILTAIVISFGVLAFAIVLVHRACQVLGTEDMDQLTATDR